MVRYSGKSVLIGLMGICLMVMAVVLGGMMQAPVQPSNLTIIAIVLGGGGVILLWVAWLVRKPKDSL